LLHLRIVTPPDLAARVLEHLHALEVVTSVCHQPGAVLRPEGDLVQCDVPNEAGSLVVETLRQLGLEERGGIAVIQLDASLSARAEQATEHAGGSSSDAVVWETLEARTASSAELSKTFLVFMVVATVLAAIGILTDSVILVIAAMIVGPELGSLAGICVGLTQRRFDLAWRSFLAILIGFPIATVAAYLATVAFIAVDLAPSEFIHATHPQTAFITNPDAYAVIVAALAGVVGMLSLSTANSGPLIGVLVSVTTIPAAGYVGVAAAYGDMSDVRGATAQLGINLGVLLVAAISTLLLQRRAFLSRWKAWIERLPARLRRRRSRGG
jgi:uncharacterized hydrophobic protein (TIGR00271 family)